jgi:hypothetical protein
MLTVPPGVPQRVRVGAEAEELGAPLTDALAGIALDVRRSYAQQARRQLAGRGDRALGGTDGG